MSWVYACKTGQANDCPTNIKKLGDTMSIKQLKDFMELDEDGESMVSPDNTNGIGDVVAPTKTTDGSGDRFDNGTDEPKNKKQKRKLKSFYEYLSTLLQENK